MLDVGWFVRSFVAIIGMGIPFESIHVNVNKLFCTLEHSFAHEQQRKASDLIAF